ncbi:hypothetical protein C8R45DRAFT_1214048 [Mycena sanguinolenta]|nr:hypothetical protein C8R45DRAFT_1214048 [Mycena sanguinolenta]
MNTLSEIFTFLKVYIGGLSVRLHALFTRTDIKSTGEKIFLCQARALIQCIFIDSTKDEESAASFSFDEIPETETEISSSLAASPQPGPSPIDNNCTGDDLLRAAVDLDLDVLPSLPSLFKLPEARTPVATPTSGACKQDFGPPSNVYYDRRPLGNVTNFRDFEQARGMKLNTEVKLLRIVKSKTKSAQGRRSKGTSPALAAVTKRPLVDDSAAAQPQVKLSFPTLAVEPNPHLATVTSAPAACLAPTIKVSASAYPVPDPQSTPPVPDPVPPVVDATSAPGSEEWNTTKAAVLAQARSWNHQVQTSGRHRSLPVPPPRPIPVHAPVDESRKRYSAPPVLVSAAYVLRPSLEGRLSALFKQAEDTIVALAEETQNAAAGSINNSSTGRKFSAVALEEGRDVFIIGDNDGEHEFAAAPRTVRQAEHSLYSLSTVNPRASSLLSSVSASRAIASASSRSLGDLLDSFDAVLASPTWRRLSSGSTTPRPNDSIV